MEYSKSCLIRIFPCIKKRMDYFEKKSNIHNRLLYLKNLKEKIFGPFLLQYVHTGNKTKVDINKEQEKYTMVRNTIVCHNITLFVNIITRTERS